MMPPPRSTWPFDTDERRTTNSVDAVYLSKSCCGLTRWRSCSEIALVAAICTKNFRTCRMCAGYAKQFPLMMFGLRFGIGHRAVRAFGTRSNESIFVHYTMYFLDTNASRVECCVLHNLAAAISRCVCLWMFVSLCAQWEDCDSLQIFVGFGILRCVRENRFQFGAFMNVVWNTIDVQMENCTCPELCYLVVVYLHTNRVQSIQYIQYTDWSLAHPTASKICHVPYLWNELMMLHGFAYVDGNTYYWIF